MADVFALCAADAAGKPTVARRQKSPGSDRKVRVLVMRIRPGLPMNRVRRISEKDGSFRREFLDHLRRRRLLVTDLDAERHDRLTPVKAKRRFIGADFRKIERQDFHMSASF